jgi:son of sevenless-like protein
LIDVRGIGFVRDIIRGFSTFLQVVADLHVAKHVDIDGFPEEVGQSPAHDMYMKTVGEARGLVRILEVTTQAIYDDSSNLLLAAQDLPLTNGKHYTQGHDECCIKLDNLIITLEANGTSVLRTLETLAFVGSRQAELADGEYRQSINLRMSKILTIEDTLRPLVSHNKMSRDFTQSDVVTEEDMFGYAKPKGVHQASPFTDPSPTDYAHPTPSYQPATADSILDGDTTTIAESDLSPVEDEDDDECELRNYHV